MAGQRAHLWAALWVALKADLSVSILVALWADLWAELLAGMLVQLTAVQSAKLLECLLARSMVDQSVEMKARENQSTLQDNLFHGKQSTQ